MHFFRGGEGGGGEANKVYFWRCASGELFLLQKHKYRFEMKRFLSS